VRIEGHLPGDVCFQKIFRLFVISSVAKQPPVNEEIATTAFGRLAMTD